MADTMYRQGDLLFRVLHSLPEGLIPRTGRVIVEGEATGHSHCLLQGSVLEDAQGELFLEVGEATRVIHQEHHAIELPAGYYRVIRQREYTPERIQRVID